MKALLTASVIAGATLLSGFAAAQWCGGYGCYYQGPQYGWCGSGNYQTQAGGYTIYSSCPTNVFYAGQGAGRRTNGNMPYANAALFYGQSWPEYQRLQDRGGRR